MSSPNGRCVVVVDDDASMSQALERILRLGGYAPITFSSAEALLEAGDAKRAVCLVLDVHLPGLSGFELYDRLASMGAQPPVIFMTAYDEPKMRGAAKSAGAAAYFTKPFSGNDLVAAIKRAIAPRETNGER
jgi:FixJ family two-component response regulator